MCTLWQLGAATSLPMKNDSTSPSIHLPIYPPLPQPSIHPSIHPLTCQHQYLRTTKDKRKLLKTTIGLKLLNMTLTKAFTKDMEGQTPTYTGAIRQIPTIHHMELVVYIFEHGIQFHTGRLVLQCSGAVIAFTCPKRFVPGPDTRGCAFSSDGSSGQFVVVWSLSCVRLFATPWMQHTRLPCPSRSPEVCSHSCPLSR